jgi:hypothetical protein
MRCRVIINRLVDDCDFEPDFEQADMLRWRRGRKEAFSAKERAKQRKTRVFAGEKINYGMSPRAVEWMAEPIPPELPLISMPAPENDPPMRGKLLIPGQRVPWPQQRVPWSMRIAAERRTLDAVFGKSNPIFAGAIGIYDRMANPGVSNDSVLVGNEESLTFDGRAEIGWPEPATQQKPKAPELVVLEPPRRKISL